MTDRELMQQALEALQKIYIAPEHEEYIRVWWPACEDAITALRERLAQPEQEPVLWLNEEKKIIYWHNTHETDDYHGFKRTVPLYTPPPQRKPWVGLTDEEKAEIWSNNETAMVVTATEKKLKEKNT